LLTLTDRVAGFVAVGCRPTNCTVIGIGCTATRKNGDVEGCRKLSPEKLALRFVALNGTTKLASPIAVPSCVADGTSVPVALEPTKRTEPSAAALLTENTRFDNPKLCGNVSVPRNEVDTPH
jgi:hypothetical protein